MSKIFVTSDLHFGHDRQFIWGARGFSSIEEMNETYVKRWNEIVSEEDHVYILGDLMLGDNEKGIDCLTRLNGTLHVVLGNHDTANRQKIYKEIPNVHEIAWAIMLPYKKYHFFMTHFPCMTGNLEKESLRQMTLNLYGHTHQTENFYEDRPYMYHVGVDSHKGIPVLLDDIIQEMKDKVKECIDFLDLTSDLAPVVGEELEDSNQKTPLIATQNAVINDSVVDLTEIEVTDGFIETRCYKCVYDYNTCGSSDLNGDCPKYKRDPPDGGFYG